MDLGLTGKVAIVTGASKGIGKAVALELAREGCQVILSARGEEELQSTTEEVRRIGDAVAITADVTKDSDVQELVEEAVFHFGRIDILVNNAGGIVGGRLPFHEISDEQWIEVFDFNLLSAVRLIRAVLPYMQEQGWGRIINIGSESATQPDALKPHYNAAKAALMNLTKSLSKAYGADGILVNAVSPATTMTPAVESMIAEEAAQKGISAEEGEAAYVREERPNIVIGRLGRPEEVASVVALLASERASFVAGANYRVDSGSVASIS